MSRMESIERSERVTDEEFVEILKSRKAGIEDDGVQFEAWQDQLTEELDAVYAVQGSEALSAKVIKRFTDRAILYYKGGFTEVAISEMQELHDAAGSRVFEGSGLFERTKDILAKMKMGNGQEL